MQALDAKHLRQFYPTLLQVTRRLHKRWQRTAAVGATVDRSKRSDALYGGRDHRSGFWL